MIFLRLYSVAFILYTAQAARQLYQIDQATGDDTALFGPALVMTNGFRNEKHSPLHNEIDLTDFFYFKTNVQKAPSPVNVHYNGFISFDDSLLGNFGTCQRRSNAREDLLAVYWVNYNTGNVRMFEHKASGNPTLSNEDLDFIARDLTETFTGEFVPGVQVTKRPSLTRANIEKVVVITWKDMVAIVNTLTERKRRHDFQSLLIKVKAEDEKGVEQTYWFVQNYYAQLGSNGNWNPFVTFRGQRCKSAKFGVSVNRADGSNRRGGRRGVYSPGFILPSIAECVTNELTYEDLGSWVYDITDESVVHQPVPPSGICRDGSPDPKCFLKGFVEAARARDKAPPPPTTTTTATVAKTSTIEPVTGQPTHPPVTRPTQTTKNTTPTPLVDVKTQKLADKWCSVRDAGIYPLPLICDVFISCSLGKVATPMVCPEGTNFNPEFLTCDHKSNFECFHENVTLTGLTNVTTPAPTHKNLCHYLKFGEFANPESCKNYYACTNSRSILMPCPAGLHFRPISESKGICDWPRNVRCKGGVRPPFDHTPTTKHPKNIYGRYH